MTSYRLDIQYDGRGFSGWASQPGKRTVQAELEEALGKVLGEPTRLTVAGRTDAGVHALGQVASFSTDRPVPESLRRALNSLTGPDLAVPSVAETADGFDARRDALSRRYRYRLDTGPAPNPFEYRRSLHWPHHFDPELADDCARLLVGVHDFTAFTPSETKHRHFDRTIVDAGWSS